MAGRFASLHSGFSDYTPPYLYLLTLSTLADGVIGRVAIIKLISMLWGVFGAYQIYAICRHANRSQQFAVLAAIVFYVLPEVSLNDIVWGQSDVIFTSFLLAFVRYYLEDRRFLAMVMYGVAVSFKPQAVFIAPFVGYVLWAALMRGERVAIVVRDALAVPLVYGLMMLPALLAGRPWLSLFDVYTGRAAWLSVKAPNIYLLVQQAFPHAEPESGAPMLARIAPRVSLALEKLAPSPETIVGVSFTLALAVCVGLLVLFLTQRSLRRPEQALTALALTAAVIPYVTPMMHERYFFAAGVLSYLLALFRPRTWPVAVCLQAAAVLSYQDFLFSDLYSGRLTVFPRIATVAAFVLVTVAIVLLIRYSLRDRRSVVLAV